VRRRLERFGPWTVDRPAGGALGFRRLGAADWDAADLRFDPGAGWSGPAWPAEPWTVGVEGLTMELRPTSSGGLGLYPEHAANLAWLGRQVRSRAVTLAPEGGPEAVGTAAVGTAAVGTEAVVAPAVLNLFAHTGLATLALARAGAAVTHVDGARATIGWARRNAELSGLTDRPVRWIVDDAAAFVAREARRGRRYDGIVLDPPAFGRGRGREWRLEASLPALLDACRAVAAPNAFVLLTAHSEATDGDDLAAMLAAAFRAPRSAIDVVEMELGAASGAQLALGWAARLGA